MSSVFEAYALDEQAENDGRWVEFRGGIRIKLRSDNSDIVRKFSNRRVKAQRQQIVANGGLLPPEQMDKNEIALCVEAVVVDWEKVYGLDGKLLPCTRENVQMLVTRLPALRREILFASRTEETFRPEVDELGKTSATSSTPSSGSEEKSSS